MTQLTTRACTLSSNPIGSNSLSGGACWLEIISAPDDDMYNGSFWIQFRKRFLVVATMLNSCLLSQSITFNEGCLYAHSTAIKPMIVQVLKKCDDWDRRFGYFRWRKKRKDEIHLLGRCWEQKTTSLTAFFFGMLVSVGKKVVCLQCRFKSWRNSRDIDCGYDIILQI